MMKFCIYLMCYQTVCAVFVFSDPIIHTTRLEKDVAKKVSFKVYMLLVNEFLSIL